MAVWHIDEFFFLDFNFEASYDLWAFKMYK